MGLIVNYPEIVDCSSVVVLASPLTRGDPDSRLQVDPDDVQLMSRTVRVRTLVAAFLKLRYVCVTAVV